MESEIIPVEHKAYRPIGGAEELFYCNDNEILLEGPAGTGKTRALLEKALFCALEFPRCRILFVRKTRKSLTESVLVTFEEKVVSDNLRSIMAGAGRDYRHSYEFPNGSTIVVGGMEDPDRIMSTEFDLICVFEATELSEEDHEKLTTRLRNGVLPVQQIIDDCNPGPPTHWLNQRANAGKMKRILSRHEDNPTISDAYLEKLRALTGARRSRLYEGRWASQEGLVYEFDETIHTCKAFPIPDDWSRYRVIDFGYTNPFVCQWWALSPDDIFYMYREIYYSQRIVSEHAKQINEFSKGERYVCTIADHDAEDRATLEAAGIRTIPAYKAVTTGIQEVEKRLMIRGNNKPGLVLMRDVLIQKDRSLIESKKPTCTREEFDSYSWPKAADGKTVKEAPVKVDDHGMDCIKYLCAKQGKPAWKAAKTYLKRESNSRKSFYNI